MKNIIKKNNFIKYALLISLITMGCQDENLKDNLDQRNLQACHDYLLFEKTVIDIEREIEHAFIATQTTKNLPNYTSLNNDTSNQDTLIINFGEDNFLHLGHLKRGEIIIIYNKFLYDMNSIISTTFSDFYINNNLLQGSMTSENSGINQQGNLEFNLEINNMSLNTENGIINLNGAFTKELVSGSSSQYQYLDNIYHVLGSAEGNSVNNNNFIINITDTLKYNLSCFESSSCIITKGKVTINPSIYNERLLDYGDEYCDCEVSAIIEGENYPLILN
tara:strand:- start:2793 stop:3623 length:831 start_codon:yes stop_codon:yes gene_type:complete